MNKQLLKKLLVPRLTNNWVSAIATKIIGSGVPIFMLHRIYPDHAANDKVTSSYLRKCLGYLKEHNYNVVSLNDILGHLKDKRTLPPKSVAFTIDDGFIDQSNIAAPIFIEFECPVTIFLITDFIDGKSWPWFEKVKYLVQNTKISSFELQSGNSKTLYTIDTDKDRKNVTHNIQKQIKVLSWDLIEQAIKNLEKITQIELPIEPPDASRPMTWSQARELEKSGLITFGPHTVSHPILSAVDIETSHNEIIQSWEKLKSELQSPCPIFCYPNGSSKDFSEREIEIIKKTDIQAALSTIPGQVQPNIIFNDQDRLFYIPRYILPTNFYDFVMYTSWIELAKEKIGYKNAQDSFY